MIEKMSFEEFCETYRDYTGENYDDRDDMNIGKAYHEYYDDDEFEDEEYDSADWSSDPQ